MSFTFDEENLSKDKVAQVRLLTGLTDPNSPISVSDESIQFLLDRNSGDINKTSLDVLNSAISKAAYAVDRNTGQVQESLSQLLENLIRLRDEMLASVLVRTPINLKATGLDSTEYEEGLEDSTVYHTGVYMKDVGPITKTNGS